MNIFTILLFSGILLNNDWTFALGNTDPALDYGHNTEYFTTLAKVGSSDHNRGPVWPLFDDSAWQKVSLPHDWAVDIPFSGEASHSHGYKCLGWKYPANSVGWYRKHIQIPEEDRGKQIFIEFEGIFRDSRIYCNGIYVGGEQSGYASSTYDISDYLNYGGDNVIAVRCDATVEEGWFYEGAGIYRNVWLRKAGPAAVKPYSVVVCDGKVTYDCCMATGADRKQVKAKIAFYDAEGKKVKRMSHLWSVDDPYLYKVEISLYYKGELSDVYAFRYGVRDIRFNPDHGFLLNGKKLFLKGANMHQDHAGVGAGIPKELLRYRVLRLKEFGFNAIRGSHGPASPDLLDVCDELGMLFIDENRQIGSTQEHLRLFENMIMRDINHPCIIIWSIGNEEWGGRAVGPAVTRRMVEVAHRLDPTRPTTYGSSSEYPINDYVDVPGYNYIVQNPVDQDHRKNPLRSAIGTEETTGCGTRGHDVTVPEKGWMASLKDTTSFRTGWEFYSTREWTAGLFYWTGFDYRGEPNPMAWPATGSQFGLFDYCGFPKSQAYQLWGEEKAVPVEPSVTTLVPSKRALRADGQDVVVIDVFSPEESLPVKVEGACLLGWGNGDPGFKEKERPTDNSDSLLIKPFAGRAQILVRSVCGRTGEAVVRVGDVTLNLTLTN